MSVRDSNFQKHIGLKQTEIAKALKCSPSKVSDGLKKDETFFTMRRLSVLAAHVESSQDLDFDEFEKARSLFLDDENSFLGSTNVLTADPTLWKFSQLWSIGSELPEYSDLEFVSSLLAPVASNSEISLVYATSDSVAAKAMFRVFSSHLRGKKDAVQVFVLISPIFRFLPPMRILDPQTSSTRVFGQAADGSQAALSEKFATGIVELFRSNGFGTHSHCFVEEDEVTDSEEMSLYAGPYEFYRGQLTKSSSPQS